MTRVKPPIKKYRHATYPKGDVTQWFGENVKLYKEAIGTNGHNGIDIVAPWGTPIYAVEGGIVCEVKDDAGGFGKHLRILSDNYEWTYGHNSLNLVKIGDKVEAGQNIANMGNTGFVISGDTPYWEHNPYAGTHLHLGCREITYPQKGGWRYNNKTPKIEVLNYDNGFKGAIDFAHLLGDYTMGQELNTTASILHFVKWLIAKGFWKK